MAIISEEYCPKCNTNTPHESEIITEGELITCLDCTLTRIVIPEEDEND